MKRRNKIILFILVLILSLLFSFTSIESAQWNVKKIIQEKEIKGDLDLNKFRKNLDFILDLETRASYVTWGRNPFELPAKLWSGKSEMGQKETKNSVSASLKLNGVMIKGKEAWAIIDGNVTQVGDLVSGWVVEKIEMGKVVLRSGQTQEVLLLD